MLDPIFVFGAFRLPVYSLMLTLALVIALVLSFRRAPYCRAQIIDTGIGALFGAVIGARLEYVALSWDYFALHMDEITRWDAGGLGWHGAVIGGLVGVWLIGRWRGVDPHWLLARFAWVIPLAALGAWIGCAAAGCGYGREVDTLANYPDWLVWESRDVYGNFVPRFSTARFGVIVGLVTAGIGLLARGERRFWLMLAVVSAGMFAIGFVRADASPMIAGLRVDQVLDALMFVWAVQRTLTTENTESTEKMTRDRV